MNTVSLVLEVEIYQCLSAAKEKNSAANEKIRCRNLVMSIGVCLSVASVTAR